MNPSQDQTDMTPQPIRRSEEVAQPQGARADDLLYPLRTVAPLATDPFFMTRLEARMQRPRDLRPVHLFELRPSLSFAAAVLLMLVNIFSLWSFLGSDTEAHNRVSSTMQEGVSGYPVPEAEAHAGEEMPADALPAGVFHYLGWGGSGFTTFSDLDGVDL